jgi:hypothetical protein
MSSPLAVAVRFWREPWHDRRRASCRAIHLRALPEPHVACPAWIPIQTHGPARRFSGAAHERAFAPTRRKAPRAARPNAPPTCLRSISTLTAQPTRTPSTPPTSPSSSTRSLHLPQNSLAPPLPHSVSGPDPSSPGFHPRFSGRSAPSQDLSPGVGPTTRPHTATKYKVGAGGRAHDRPREARWDGAERPANPFNRRRTRTRAAEGLAIVDMQRRAKQDLHDSPVGLTGRRGGIQCRGSVPRLASVAMDPHAGLVHSRSSQLSLVEPLLGAGDVAGRLAVLRSRVYEYARRRHDALPSIRVRRHV